jgi:hypothetical protein
MIDVDELREYLVANMFDGDDGGRVTMACSTLVDEVVEIVSLWLEDKTLLVDQPCGPWTHQWLSVRDDVPVITDGTLYEALYRVRLR